MRCIFHRDVAIAVVAPCFCFFRLFFVFVSINSLYYNCPTDSFECMCEWAVWKRLTWPSAYARAIACECMCACDNAFIWITANIPYVCTYASKVFRLLLPNSNEMRMYWFSMYTYTTTEWTTQCLLFVFRTIFLYPPLVDFKIHFPFRIFRSYRELHV